MVIFVDYTGAFDNLAWGPVLERLRSLPGVDYPLWESYFRERVVVAQDGRGRSMRRPVVQGCPQGSIVGPYIWNLMADSLLRRLEGAGFGPAAYADDFMIPVEAPNRVVGCEVGTYALTLVDEWCREVGVEVSRTKTTCTMVKGATSDRTTVAMSPFYSRDGRVTAERVPYLVQNVYLGVRFSEGLNFRAHLTHVDQAVKSAVAPLTRVMRAEWGVRGKTLRRWQVGLFQAVALFGCTAWGSLVRAPGPAANRLLATQRHALQAGLPVVRTTSVAALQVLSGSVPWDLEVHRRVALWRAKRGEDTPVLGVRAADSREVRMKASIVATACAWQGRWERASTGRVTYAFLPEVAVGLRIAGEELSWPLCYLMTGHGDMADYLFRHRSRQDPLCGCGMGEREEPDHMVRRCPWYAQERAALSRGIGRDVSTEPLSAILPGTGALHHFARFAAQVFARRADIIQREVGGLGG